MDIIKSIEHEQLKNKIPELKVGNTVKVHVRIKEGNKERKNRNKQTNHRNTNFHIFPTRNMIRSC